MQPGHCRHGDAGCKDKGLGLTLPLASLQPFVLPPSLALLRKRFRWPTDLEVPPNLFFSQESMFENNRALQDAGKALAGRLTEVRELSLVKQHVQEAQAAVEVCCFPRPWCNAWDFDLDVHGRF